MGTFVPENVNTMKKKVISKYDYRYKGVSLDPVSKTVPDQSLSVEDILRRFTQGVLSESEIVRDHQYGDDVNPDEDFDNLDPQYDPDYDLVDAFEQSQKVDELRAEMTASARRARQSRQKKSSSQSTAQQPSVSGKDAAIDDEEGDENAVI